MSLDFCLVLKAMHFVKCGKILTLYGSVGSTGDLTDGKNSDNIGSTQYEDEWMTYKDVLTKANVHNSSFWLDIRGNHGECYFEMNSPLFSFSIMLIMLIPKCVQSTPLKSVLSR